MRLTKIYVVTIMALGFAACHTLKSSSGAKTGVHAPGESELAAIRAKHSGVTMQTLKDGYALYTGVCTNCHAPKSIYERPEEAWPAILTSMANEAKITDAQKDAVYQYVLSIKATQPK